MQVAEDLCVFTTLPYPRSVLAEELGDHDCKCHPIAHLQIQQNVEAPSSTPTPLHKIATIHRGPPEGHRVANFDEDRMTAAMSDARPLG